ncbi:MAG: uncharacterized protein QOK25_2168 [Thermoleophilaceae bacterium]|jgi:uncharacterized protein (DUF779 family)|nr:uncharacterized protein [Thermoleophilaceae bacterium]
MPAVNVVLTEAAAAALRQVRAERGDDLTLVIGNGCCDSTAPFLFSRHFSGPGESPVGQVDGVPVVLDSALVDLYDGHEVVIDCGADPGGDSFSCETELGLRLSMDRLPVPR